MAVTVSVIIPAKDCRDVIGQCLDSLSEQSLSPVDVIVVDDGSSDGTGEVAGKNAISAKVIRQEESAGYAGASNRGLAETSGDWIAVLNADTEAHPDFIAEMASATTAMDNVGMVASRVLLAGTDGLLDSAGLRMHRSGMAFLRGHKSPDRPDDTLPVSEDVFGPAGSAAMYKRELIETAGFFEPDYFIYYEDVDLAWRARWKGYSCVLANRARIMHHHSYTMSGLSATKRYLLQRNRGRTMARNWPLSWFVKYSPWIAPYNMGSVFVAAREGNLRSAARARVDFLKYLGPDLKASKNIIEPGRTREMEKWLSQDSYDIQL